jgi:REP element-mobilizing transposase RayT
MAVRKAVPEKEGLYYITITCARWHHLFEIANGYSAVYDWFDYLKSQGHFICAYVVMPNHLHSLIGFRRKTQSPSSQSLPHESGSQGRGLCAYAGLIVFSLI